MRLPQDKTGSYVQRDVGIVFAGGRRTAEEQRTLRELVSAAAAAAAAAPALPASWAPGAGSGVCARHAGAPSPTKALMHSAHAPIRQKLQTGDFVNVAVLAA
jgi:hypothetical protein